MTTHTTTTESGTSDEQHPVKIQRFMRNLPVKLTDREIVERAQRAAHLSSEIEQQEEEVKAAQKQAKARIDEIDAERRRLNLEVLDGKKYGDVSCERRYVYRLGVVQEVRTDSGEQLSERPMTDRERQLEFPDANGEKKESDEASEGSSEAEDIEAADDDGIVDDDYNGEDEPDPEPDLPTQKKKGRKKKGAAN